VNMSPLAMPSGIAPEQTSSAQTSSAIVQDASAANKNTAANGTQDAISATLTRWEVQS
jgi:hypothetical protein